MDFFEKDVFRSILILGTTYLFYKYSDCLFKKENNTYENVYKT